MGLDIVATLAAWINWTVWSVLAGATLAFSLIALVALWLCGRGED